MSCSRTVLLGKRAHGRSGRCERREEVQEADHDGIRQTEKLFERYVSGGYCEIRLPPAPSSEQSVPLGVPKIVRQQSQRVDLYRTEN